MVGGRLDCFDTIGIMLSEVRDDMIKKCIGGIREGRYLADIDIGGQHLQPAHFNGNTRPDQTIFTEDRS